jgi:uncharacterized protein (TIGR02996 family)
MKEAILSAIFESPGDGSRWLALADWLDEVGQRQTAELVRLSWRVRALPVASAERESAEARIAALLRARVRPVVPEVVNDLGMRFALIPPGRFRMGSPPGEAESEEFSEAVQAARAYETEIGLEETVHEVELTRGFFLGLFPVTQWQYETVTGTNPSYFGRRDAGKGKVQDIPDAELSAFPVESVRWSEAQQFVNILNARPESREKSWEYRLPTEAEWEYACRGGGVSSTPFHVGASLSSCQANFDGNYPCSRAEKGPYLGRTCAVGSYVPNVLGLFDMHGNVWEWCQDWHDKYVGGAAIDPTGPPKGVYRVIRGGAFNFPGWFCRAAHRFGYSPEDKLASVGFRIVLSTRKHYCNDGRTTEHWH